MSKGLTINKLFAYVIAFFLLLDGSNMWQLTSARFFGLNDIRLILVAVCLVCVIATLSIKKVQINYHFLRNMVIISIVFMAFWLTTRYNFIYFFRVQYLMFMTFTLYIYVMMKYGLIMDLVKAFINIWLVIAVVTTVIWFFGSILNVIPLRQTLYVWYDDYLRTFTFHNIYFANPIQNTTVFDVKIFRNTGLYAEAPGTANYYIYALGLELAFLSKDKGHKRRLITFVITSFTTLSTKVLITVPVLLFLSYILKPKREQTESVIQLLKFGSIMIALGVIIRYGYLILMEKSTTGSFAIRVDDILTTLRIFSSSPIYGIGLGNTAPIISGFNVSARNNNGLSMGLFIMLAQGGLWLATMYLSPLFLLIRRFIKSNEYRHYIVFGVAVLSNLIISNISNAPSFIIMVAAGYAYFNLTENEKQELLLQY